MFRALILAAFAVLILGSLASADEPRLTNPLAPKGARVATSQIWERHIRTGSLGELEGSVGACGEVDEILVASLRTSSRIAMFGELDRLNISLNVKFDLDGKAAMLLALGVPEECILVTANFQEGAGEVAQLVLRMDDADYVLLDNVEPIEGGGVVAWRDIVRAGAGKQYSFAGANWENAKEIINN